MNKVQHMLLKLSEECNEVGQAASKSMQFCLDDSYNGVTNRDRLIGEIKDLVSVVHILNEEFGLGYEFDSVHLEEKRKKINKYLQLSVDNGHVKED